MKNILIVEDDENKRNQLIKFIEEKYNSIEVDIAKSFHSGLESVLSKQYDLILLDITMPTYDISHDEDGGRPQQYAGRDLLRQMKRRKLTATVIVVTQYDVFGDESDSLSLSQLDKQLNEDYPDIYHGTVYYNAAIGDWKNILEETINQLHSNGDKQ